jgi:hypothetical protein
VRRTAAGFPIFTSSAVAVLLLTMSALPLSAAWRRLRAEIEALERWRDWSRKGTRS